MTGQFRILCDGEHYEGAVEEEEEVLDAVASEPVHETPPKIEPPL